MDTGDLPLTHVVVIMPFVTPYGVAEMQWSCSRATASKDGSVLTVTSLTDGRLLQEFDDEKPWLRATITRADGTRIATLINESYGVAGRSPVPAA